MEVLNLTIIRKGRQATRIVSYDDSWKPGETECGMVQGWVPAKRGSSLTTSMCGVTRSRLECLKPTPGRVFTISEGLDISFHNSFTYPEPVLSWDRGLYSLLKTIKFFTTYVLRASFTTVYISTSWLALIH